MYLRGKQTEKACVSTSLLLGALCLLEIYQLLDLLSSLVWKPLW